MPDLTTFSVDDPFPRNQFVHSVPFLEWLRDHDIEASDTFRVDVGADEITVHQYALNGEGRKHVDSVTGEIVYREPFTVPLKRAVPELSVHA